MQYLFDPAGFLLILDDDYRLMHHLDKNDIKDLLDFLKQEKPEWLE